jgi:hypothetical protein
MEAGWISGGEEKGEEVKGRMGNRAKVRCKIGNVIPLLGGDRCGLNYLMQRIKGK